MSETVNTDLTRTEAHPPTWLRRVWSVLLVIFCFELGLFLLIYPWSPWWTANYYGVIAPDVWQNAYLRGAVSGVGVLNVWVAITEVFRLFSRK